MAHSVPTANHRFGRDTFDLQYFLAAFKPVSRFKLLKLFGVEEVELAEAMCSEEFPHLG